MCGFVNVYLYKHTYIYIYKEVVVERMIFYEVSHLEKEKTVTPRSLGLNLLGLLLALYSNNEAPGLYINMYIYIYIIFKCMYTYIYIYIDIL